MTETGVRTPFSRLFTIEGRAGPTHAPVYQGQGRAMSPSWGFGDRTPIREPDPDRYGGFKIVGAIKGERDLPTLQVESRYAYTLSAFLRLGRIGCPLDVQVHVGKCQDPRDFNGGWDKILMLDGADISQWAASELGALEQGQDAVINETIDFNGLDMYEVVKLSFGAIAGSQIVQEVFDVAICDAVSCGDCGLPSNGCEKFFAIQTATGGSPGLPAELVYSKDGGNTIGESNITSLSAAQNPSALECVGSRLVVLSTGDCSIHYAFISNILADTETWTRSVLGLVCAAGAPTDIFSAGTAFTWIVGNGGYIYFYTDITGTAVVQSAGTVTVQNLNAIHGIDENNLVAVGNSNAILRTVNGGDTWALVVGPTPGVALNAIWMKDENTWFIGTASPGELWYTTDAGATWTRKDFSGSGAGSVTDIVFSTPSVGYMAHTNTAPAGRIFRTINGGNSWYLLPEGSGGIPTNQRINALAACGDDPNFVLGGGLGVGTDGILVKASGA